MRVIVLGGGVVGVTTAYFLAREGHEVEVIEQEDRLAGWASSGNAGLIAPGHSFAWASPTAPKMLLRSLAGAQTAIRVRPRLDPALIGWGLRFLRECTDARARANTLVKLRLCQYSQRVLEEVVAEEKLEYGARTQGVFYLYRDKEAFDLGVKRMSLLQENGQQQDILDAEECVKREPAFGAIRDQIAGAVYDRTDSSGDCAGFTEALADVCRNLGVRFRLGTRVQALISEGDRVTAALTDDGRITGDLYVLSLGVHSAEIARTVGRRLPIYPAKGYSVTFPIRDGDEPPTHGGVDEQTLVAWANFGDQLRVSSTAEFAGYSRSWRERDFNNIMSTVKLLFPKAADYSAGRYRACLRPMTPDGPPIIGFGKHHNLLYNTGHGHMGWTMAAGSARIATDIALRRRPEIDIQGMGVR